MFRLTLDQSPSLEIEGLVDVPLPTFTIASNGTFSLDAAFPVVGVAGFRISGASMRIEKTGAALSTVAGRITGAALVDRGERPDRARRRWTSARRPGSDETFTVSGWNLGPFLRTSSTSVRVRHLSTGHVDMTVMNTPSVTAFNGSVALVLNSFTASTDGTFDGSITGQLTVAGTRLASSTFSLTRDGTSVRMSLDTPATYNFGFLSARLSGFARSDGTFSFNGSSSVALGVTGFSFSGSTSVRLSSTDGITGSFSGRVCILSCASTSGTLRSDGRIRGFLQIDLNNDGDFADVLEVNAEWRVYLATGGVRVDINRDGDYNDLGDVAIGDTTSDDDTNPSMTTPPNMTVVANIGSTGRVRVYYTPPTATDGGISLTVSCSPTSGSEFVVGATTVTCTAVDRAGNATRKTFTVTVNAEPAVATQTVIGGSTVTVTAPGFMSESLAGVRLFSDPIDMGVETANAAGDVIFDVVIPAGLPPGNHDIVVLGIGVKGGIWQYVKAIVVADPDAALPGALPATPATRIDPPVAPDLSPAAPVLPSGRLPATGSDVGTSPFLTFGASLLVLGLLSILVTRRRRSGAHTRPG